jgi:hypothetical protein
MSTTPKKYRLVLSNGLLTRYVTIRSYFVKHKAYAFDEAPLEKLRGQWHTLQIITKAGKRYEVSESDFYKCSYLNSDYGKLQRLIGIADMRVKETKQNLVRVHPHFYNELKAEANRTQLPMSSLLQIKRASK